MKIRFKYQLLIILLWNSLFLFAQNRHVEFEYLNSNHGLAQNHVFSINQDDKGFMWFCTMGGLSKYDGFNFVNYYHSPEDSTSLSSSFVDKFFQDSKGRLWVSSVNGFNQFYRILGKFKRYYHKIDDPGSLGHNTTKDIVEDSDGMLWIVHGKGVDKFDPGKEFFEHYFYENFSVGRHSGDLLIDSEGNIWVLGLNGLYLVNRKEKTLELIGMPEINTDVIVEGRSIYQDSYGNIWVAFNRGLYIFEPNTNSFKLAQGLPHQLNSVSLIEYSKGTLVIGTTGYGIISYDIIRKEIIKIHNYDASDPKGISSTTVYSLYKDKFNNLWIGLFNGINMLNYETQRFELIQNETGINNLKNFTLLVYGDRNGGLWSNTMEGLYYRPPGLKEYIKISCPPEFPEGYNDVRGIADLDEESVIINIRSNGLFKFNRKNGNIQKIGSKEFLKNDMISNIINDIRDPKTIWMSGIKGLGKFNIQTENINWFRTDTIFKNRPASVISHFSQSEMGIIYFVLHSSLIAFNPTNGNFKIQPVDGSIDGNVHSVHCVKNNIWIATRTSIYLFDILNNNLKKIKDSNNKTFGAIGLQVDHNKNAWSIFGNEITRIEHEKHSLKKYRTSSGFIIGIGDKMNDGRILFGSGEGVIVIDPINYFRDTIKPQIVFTGLKIANKDIYLGLENEFVKSIYLDYKDKVFTLSYAALHFIHRNNINYRYKLKGFDDEWIDAGNIRSATYTNLNPGKYTFLVEAITEDGLKSDNNLELMIYINSPFYMTNMFYFLILISVGSLIFLFHRIRIKAVKAIREKDIAEQNAKYKDLFMANISHEIRTPMNAILGLNNLLLDTPLNEKQNQYVNAIKTSGENLIWIINDILDQAKIETGKYKIVLSSFDLTATLEKIKTLFEYRAQIKNLEFKVLKENKLPNILIGDQVRVFQILINLLNNAIKFTQSGYVHLEVKSSDTVDNMCKVSFCVADSGIGIPRDKIPLIFESFKQLNEDDNIGNQGLGLGLSIVKKLIEQLGGNLKVDSTPGKGTRFYFDLMMKKGSPVYISDDSKLPILPENMKILLVEDTVFNQMLAIELLKKYGKGAVVDLAENGSVAIEKIKSKIYDLVLMDVRMPVLDGISATSIIRKMDDNYFTNIPILGLTANAIPQEIQSCLESGMNDVITKPIIAGDLVMKIYKATKITESNENDN